MDLMRMARTYKRYPRVAMDNNWEGRVVIRMVIGSNGMISTISVLNSAGHEVLDKQALDMIQKAKPRVQIPAALRGKEFTLEIPVIYSLKEADAG
jgi:protein TonB